MLCLVTGVQSYDFEDEKTGRRIQGGKIQMFDTTPSDETDTFTGKRVSTVKVSLALLPHFKSNGPGLYNLDFVPDTRGKDTTIKLAGVQPIKPVEINQLITNLNK